MRVNEDRTKNLTVARKIPNLDYETVGYVWNSRMPRRQHKNSSDGMYEKINERIARSNRNGVMKLCKVKTNVTQNSKTLSCTV